MPGTCPTCGGPLKTRSPAIELQDIRTGPVERAVLDVMCRAHPRSLGRNHILADVYFGTREPESADSVLTTVMCRLRKKIAPYGWSIPVRRGGRGTKARYQLECAKESPEAPA